MAKATTQFTCQACGAFFPRWVGRCTSCGAWNTLVEETVARKPAGGRAPGDAGLARPVKEIDQDHAARIPTGIG